MRAQGRTDIIWLLTSVAPKSVAMLQGILLSKSIHMHLLTKNLKFSEVSIFKRVVEYNAAVSRKEVYSLKKKESKRRYNKSSLNSRYIQYPCPGHDKSWLNAYRNGGQGSNRNLIAILVFHIHRFITLWLEYRIMVVTSDREELANRYNSPDRR